MAHVLCTFILYFFSSSTNFESVWVSVCVRSTHSRHFWRHFKFVLVVFGCVSLLTCVRVCVCGRFDQVMNIWSTRCIFFWCNQKWTAKRSSTHSLIPFSANNNRLQSNRYIHMEFDHNNRNDWDDKKNDEWKKLASSGSFTGFCAKWISSVSMSSFWSSTTMIVILNDR